MNRIGQEVPVLPVPAVAHVLQEQTGAISEDALTQKVGALLADVPEAHVHMPRDDAEYMVTVGLRNLRKRGLVQDSGDGVIVAETDRALVAYYAKSIAHLVQPAP